MMLSTSWQMSRGWTPSLIKISVATLGRIWHRAKQQMLRPGVIVVEPLRRGHAFCLKRF